jgi:hypothetical protein
VRVLKLLIVSLLFVFANFAPAFAEGVNIEGLTVWFGDTVDKVKDTYKTPLDPEPSDSPTQRGGTQLRLKTKGVWFFFNRDGKIYTIRIEAPFHGTINGVKIGDTAAKMMKVLGQPAKTPKPFAGVPSGFMPRSYIYYLDDVTTANFQVNVDDEIETVFLSK